MDDGKCLLDVISDPQALKEFFRSTSQIAFVDGDASPVKQENVDRQQNKNTVIQNVIKNDTLGHSSMNQVTNIQTSKSGPISGGLFSQQQTRPLGHFPSSSGSDLNKHSSTFTSYVRPPSKNGLPGNISSSSVHTNVPYSARSDLGTSTLNKTSPISNLQNTVSSIQTVPSVTLGKERLPLPRTSYSNTPISFALGDANKARNLLSVGTQVVSSLEKSGSTIPKPHASQQLLTHPVQLKPSPSKLISGIGSPNRTTIVKTSVLPPLRPKKIIPRPSPSQNVAAGISGEQHNIQVGVQGNLLPQGVKGKVVVTTKGQPLIAIQPKLLITSQGGVVSNSLANQNPLNLGKPNQPLASNFTIGPKVQTQNQVFNSLVVQPQKSSIQSGNQSNVPLTNLVQLQPKQIAPKPQDHSVSFPVPAKQKLSLEQVQIQQRLLQNLLGQTQQKQSQQFAGQANVSLVVKNEAQSNSGDKESVAKQQNQLKELLQQTQMLQQVMQVRRMQQQQQQQQPQKIPPVTNVQVNATAAPSQLETNQTSALQSLINSSLVRQGQPKLQQSVVQQTIPATPTLVGQTTDIVNTKQLHEFLKKNPAFVQQLEQLNLKQANTSGNINTAATTSVKNVVQLQKTVKPAVTTQVAIPVTKKLVVASSVLQPQVPVINQAQRTDQKAAIAGPQKVLIIQHSNSGATTTVGQPRVLLQTKEGRPILLSQEQFRQIQQQLAAKNLNLQGKLVTTTTKSQVVLKANDTSSVKTIPKMTTTTPTMQVKQDATKGVKRPVKAVESEESKLIKRMKGVLQKDQNSVSVTGLHQPFKSHEDATKSLVPFHVFSEPDPNDKMQQKANTLLDKLALQLTNKSDRMINKYRHLILGDLQRDVPSAELVMVNRIFLADEKLALMKEKKMVLEEAQNMAKSIAENSKAIKQENSLATAAITPALSDIKNEMQLFPTSSTVFGEELSSQINANEQQIDIMDSSPSPITSANSFLSDLSRTSSELSLTQSLMVPNRTPEPI